jgi:small-conductance mechanosensitive channel
MNPMSMGEAKRIMYALKDRLDAYKSTGLTPDEIRDHEEIFKAYRNVCGGKSPEEIQSLQSENAQLRAKLDKAIEDMENCKQENEEPADQERNT